MWNISAPASRNRRTELWKWDSDSVCSALPAMANPIQDTVGTIIAKALLINFLIWMLVGLMTAPTNLSRQYHVLLPKLFPVGWGIRNVLVYRSGGPRVSAWISVFLGLVLPTAMIWEG